VRRQRNLTEIDDKAEVSAWLEAVSDELEHNQAKPPSDHAMVDLTRDRPASRTAARTDQPE